MSKSTPPRGIEGGGRTCLEPLFSLGGEDCRGDATKFGAAFADDVAPMSATMTTAVMTRALATNLARWLNPDQTLTRVTVITSVY
jgi:hypothetical protein